MDIKNTLNGLKGKLKNKLLVSGLQKYLNFFLKLIEIMGRCILLTSGKGGVGKTTLTSNLAAILSKMGYETLAIDANFTDPNLGIHLGTHLVTKTLHDVLRGDEKLENVIYTHPLGFKVIPGSLSINALKNINYKKLSSIILKLLSKFDFILLDSAAGLGEETMSAMDSVGEVLVVTNPDLPSVTDAFKTIKYAEKKNKKVIGVVLNRVKKTQYELNEKELSEMFGVPIIGSVPEDISIAKSIHKKIPVVNIDSNSPAAKEIRKIAHKIVGKHYYETEKEGLFDRLLKLFGK
jgi:septum site-determining protein MinD